MCWSFPGRENTENPIIPDRKEAGGIPYLRGTPLCFPPFFVRATKKGGKESAPPPKPLLPALRLLVGSSYGQMQIFSRVFDIKFKNGKMTDYTYQTELGFSYRILLASLWLTSDEKGLSLLPDVAPVQVCVMAMQPDDPRVREQCIACAKQLSETGIRAACDLGRGQLHRRFTAIEENGIPVRACIGQREIDGESVQVQRRDTGERHDIQRSQVIPGIQHLLKQITASLKEKVQNQSNVRIYRKHDAEDAAELVSNGNILALSLCFREQCVALLQSKIGKGEVLGFRSEKAEEPCVICAQSTNQRAYVSRRI